ncbi:hypothetical protein Tco_0927641 [Tanacetum coccineum]
MNDLDRNKLTPSLISTNLKFLNHLQPEWAYFVTRVKQSMDLYKVDYNKLYNYLKQNQTEANEITTTRLAKSHDPLALYSRTPVPASFALLEKSPQQPQYTSPINILLLEACTKSDIQVQLEAFGKIVG